MTPETINLFQRQCGPYSSAWLIHDCGGPMCHKCYMATWGWHRSYMGFWINIDGNTLEDNEADSDFPVDWHSDL